MFYTMSRGDDMKHLIKEVINYMEENLLENITQQDVARHVHVSVFHLYRFFKVVTNISMTEYIRNRRLSLAGMDVLATDLTMLDIALKYHYETQEGFQKAFYRFHEINPLKARQTHASLKTYQPLKIYVSFKGGSSMDYRIEKLEPFTLTCVKRKFLNSIIDEDNNIEIPNFWTEMKNSGTLKALYDHSINRKMYGPCGSIDHDSDYFEYGIGVLADQSVHESFEKWEIKHPLYAVFKVNKAQDLKTVWNMILEEFLPNSDFEMADQPDFELYPNQEAQYFCEVWIPIQ
jgi:AraC family transcriptional regulator